MHAHTSSKLPTWQVWLLFAVDWHDIAVEVAESVHHAQNLKKGCAQFRKLPVTV